MKISLPEIRILEVTRLSRANTVISTENKECFVLSCRLSGESLFYYNNAEHRVERGDVLFIPAHSCYSQSCVSEELICFHLEIDGNVPKEIRIIKPADSDEMCNLFSDAYKFWSDRANNYSYLCMSELYKVLGLSDILTVKDGGINERLLPAVEYIERNLYSNEFSLENACKKAAISRIYFNKLFKENFSVTPVEYVNKKRIAKAKVLLESGIYTREEIALQCGFNDVKYFYTVFKNYTGMTTGEYLKK